MKIDEILGAFIESKRRKLAYTQAELAKLANISRALLIKIESEGSNLTINNTYKLFRALETDFNEFNNFLKDSLLSNQINSALLSDEDKCRLKEVLNEQGKT